ASEPLLKSLTNLDIDSRGRVWVCDVMNYRRNQGSRPEGDRILILEDTDGDGVTDTSKTFYQGRDIDSAMGLCVLDHEAGCDVIVTASPNVWKFSDHDGDGVPESKVALFTGVGDPQHDHSGHSFLFGPDGKLYWNFGNTGKRVNDADGNPVVDIHGRIVVDNGKPFYGGMPFRCDLDGSNFEVLAHNFRNNWETTVDSFGTLWQSDNDDDGNKGTRINFVMEHGNYGYLDEMTGKGWREDRINLEPEIMHRHWHLHDPGVVPNLLQTGAGSPSGICFYEGRLLPERFWDQMIHCDPGPNMVRAYPTRSAGAGYTAVIEPLLTGIEDRWFRPADVCVAPDGSLFVSDWYDPGVGGHRQGDSDRGRLFRIAPPGVGYTLPDYDYSSAEGATEALRNPNVAIRARAWRSLNAMGADAKPALEKMADDPNPRMAARALWLLGKIEGESNPTVERAMRHPDPDVRIMAIRLAKQHTKQPSQWLTDAVDDESPAVRRELAVALRFDESETMPVVWARLAAKHDGQDRWYLEALGIGSDLRAAECLDAYMKLVDGQWDTPGGRDIVWRVRAPKAADAIVSLLADPKLSAKATERYFRSLEFHSAEVRNVALMKLIPSDSGGDPRSDIVAIRAAERMSDPSLLQRPEVMAAVDRQLDRAQGTPDFIRIIKRFQPKGIEKRLLTVLDGEDASAGVEAAESLLELEAGRAALRKRLQSGDVRATEYVGFVGNARANHFLAELIVDAERSYDQRRVAIEALAKTRDGANRLLAAAEQKKLLGDSVLVAGAMLSRNSSQGIRIRAGQLLPTPSQKDDKPLPPIDQLAKMNGDLERGRKLFEGTATCSKCHVVGGKGKEVGPNLSEIGNKLSREAMLTAILAPSAGISHNYEGYTVLTDEGQVIAGLKLSESDKEIVIRTADAIDRKIPSEEIEALKKNEKSLMPENLHHLTGQQGLIDLVEYMTSLKKKEQRTRQQTTQ
ncbi:MAG: PVC-type heme-binding CxxCH protein, partial [Planctomycetota bacterium]